jgi:hypothetical protein
MLGVVRPAVLLDEVEALPLRQPAVEEDLEDVLRLDVGRQHLRQRLGRELAEGRRAGAPGQE